MLVVMGIFGVLAGLLVPVLIRSRSKARMVVCANNLKGLGQAYTLCLIESSGYLPDSYYTFEEEDEGFRVALKTPENADPDAFLKSAQADILACPSDSGAVTVLASTTHGAEITAPASYAYNVSLPLLFRNAARVRQPVNTVTFYDGDPAGVVGAWTHELGWACDTIRKRHLGQANYLYLDGHVEPSVAFPDLAFEGGAQLVAWGDNNGDGGDDGYDGDDDDVDFIVEDGEVIPGEPCTVTITCIGSEYWRFGPSHPRVPVGTYYRVNNGSMVEVVWDTRGGEQAVISDFDSGDALSIVGQANRYVGFRRESNGGTGHCWALRDGDVVPSIAGACGQDGVELFLEPYTDGDGCLVLGVNDVIFLFEMSPPIDYTRYSSADFQDLVVLVSLSSGGDSQGQGPFGGTAEFAARRSRQRSAPGQPNRARRARGALGATSTRPGGGTD